MFQVLGKSDNSNRFWTPCCVLLRNFLHFLPSFCLHISKTMESDIFSFMWKTDKTVRFVRNQQLGSQIILHANLVYPSNAVSTNANSTHSILIARQMEKLPGKQKTEKLPGKC